LSVQGADVSVLLAILGLGINDSLAQRTGTSSNDLGVQGADGRLGINDSLAQRAGSTGDDLGV
jgi:hypothetical protein